MREAPPDIENCEQLERDLIFVGLIGMIDPPRAEVQPALEIARDAGIRTIMITGDYPNTASAIAENIRLLQARTPGADRAAISNDAYRRAARQEVQRTDVFARVSPEHKMRIVEALRAMIKSSP